MKSVKKLTLFKIFRYSAYISCVSNTPLYLPTKPTANIIIYCSLMEEKKNSVCEHEITNSEPDPEEYT